jgi:hypothetical protein
MISFTLYLRLSEPTHMLMAISNNDIIQGADEVIGANYTP